MNKLVAIAVLSTVLGLGQAATAQVVYPAYRPVVGGFDYVTNTITYRPAVAAVVAYSPAVPVAAPCWRARLAT